MRSLSFENSWNGIKGCVKRTGGGIQVPPHRTPTAIATCSPSRGQGRRFVSRGPRSAPQILRPMPRIERLVPRGAGVSSSFVLARDGRIGDARIEVFQDRFRQETGPLGERMAIAAAGLIITQRMTNVEPVFRPRQRDVKQPPLFLDLLRFSTAMSDGMLPSEAEPRRPRPIPAPSPNGSC